MVLGAGGSEDFNLLGAIHASLDAILRERVLKKQPCPTPGTLGYLTFKASTQLEW